MRGSWCHLWSISVSSYGWKVPFLTLAFLGLPSVVCLNTNVYRLPFLLKQLQPVCPERQLLWLPYQCLWQKAVKEDNSVCSAAISSNNPVRPSAVILHKRKRVGGRTLLLSASLLAFRHKGKLHASHLSERWATNSCQSCSTCLYMRVAAVAALWAPTALVKMPSRAALSAPSPHCWMWLRATIQPLDCKWLGAGIMLFFYVKQEQPTLSVLIKKSCCSTLIPWAIVRASQYNMQETGWILRPARLRKGWVDGKTACRKNKPPTHGGTRQPSIDVLNNAAA